MSYWIGNPERLIVKVGLVEFEDEDGRVDVDWKPLLLGGLPKIYTNEADSTNKDVNVKILVSVFGLARRVIIDDELSDNVREEVLQAAQKARFRPAIKNGQPVAYWSTLTIQIRSKLNVSSRIGSV